MQIRLTSQFSLMARFNSDKRKSATISHAIQFSLKVSKLLFLSVFLYDVEVCVW